MSGIEVSVPERFNVLMDIINQHDNYDGIAFFSAFMLPQNHMVRKKIYNLISLGKSLHFCLEQMDIHEQNQLTSLEDLLAVRKLLPKTPFQANYDILRKKTSPLKDLPPVKSNIW